MADPAAAQRLGISGDQCRRHLEILRTHRNRDAAAFTAKIQAVYVGRSFDQPDDPDLMLYSGGFFGEQDKRAMEKVREMSPEDLATGGVVFEDRRLPQMLFRYRARNFPQSLSPQEHAAWEEFRYERLTDPGSGAGYCMEEFQGEIEALMSGGKCSAAQQAVLEQLLDYADTLLA
jgi:exodeoxyribonuclease-1